MDLLSRLPDEVLGHILSFRTTKEAALTSVLSKRWRNVLAFVPSIDIDDSVFLHPEEGKREREGVLQSFMDFVDRVLVLQGDATVKKFSLKVNTGIDTDRVNRWICNALQRGVSYLELFLEFPRYSDDDSEYDYFLPWEIHTSKTLVEVKLRSEYGVDWLHGGPSSVLPLLKTLDINSDMIVLYIRLERFLQAFPMLEELHMADIQWFDNDESASSASLKKLTICACGFDDLENPKSISFDIPSLLYLDYFDFVAADYPKVNLKNLVEAKINLRIDEDQIERTRALNDEDDITRRFRNVSKLMRGIRNVQKLSLSPTTLEVLSVCCESMPVFNNLKHLRIASNEKLGWQAMPVLFRSCPHLETLVLQDLLHYETDKCGDACDCIPREDRGSSLSSCPVKTLQIEGMTGDLRNIKLMEHFLKSFPCLKEMKVTFKVNYSPEFEPARTLGMYETLLKYFNTLSSCDVYFLYTKCTAQ